MKSLLVPLKLALGYALMILISPLVFYLLCCFVPIMLLIPLLALFHPEVMVPDGATRRRALMECAGMLGQAAIAIVACRALMVLVYARLPSALRHLDGLLPAGLAEHLGEAPSLLLLLDRPLAEVGRFLGAGFIPRFDLVLAGAGLLVTLGQALLDGAWRVLTVRHIENLPRARARSVALGLAELAGKARPLEGADASKPILRHALERRGTTLVARKEIRSFHLEDETGRILIDPTGADFPAPLEGTKKARHHGRIFGHRVREILLTRRIGGAADAQFEALLMPGDEVYVIGTVARRGRRASAATERSEGKVIRPRGGRLGGFGFHDVFFLSDTGEIHARDYFYSGIRHAIATALQILVLSAGLGLVAYRGLEDMPAAYGYPVAGAPRP